jgi:hypothetical protein
VLKRIDLTKSFPKEGLALIKDMQSFVYGSFVDNFYLMVSTELQAGITNRFEKINGGYFANLRITRRKI